MRHRQRRFLRLAVPFALLGSVLLVGCSKSSKSSASTTTAKPVSVTPVNQVANVKVTEYAFTQPSVTVKVGQAVLWTNDGNVDHTVTETAADSIASPEIKPGQTYTLTFQTPGTYAYICSIHPDSMKGTVIVQAAH